MSNIPVKKIKDPTAVEGLSNNRMLIMSLIDTLSSVLANKPPCIAEMTLAKRELQSARHWLGECLSYYDTGYRVTDNPKDPGSESKSAQ